jgi:hypothetical protein
MDNKPTLTPGNIVILVAGAVILIGSFLDFYKAKTITVAGFTLRAGGGNAWSTGAFLIVTLPALLGLIMAVHVAVSTFATGVRFPDRVLGLTWDQIHLVLGFQAAVMMLAYLIRSHSGVDFGTGFWLMFLAAIALLVGAIMRTRDAAGAPPRLV